MEITPILCPTRGFSGVPATTLMTVVNSLMRLHKQPVYVQGGAIGYAAARNHLMRSLREKFPQESTMRGFWIDDDILLMNSFEDLIPAIQKADHYRWNIVGAYHTVQLTTYTIAHGDRKLFTEEEAEKLEPYAPVPFAGLGFYYGDLPMHYEFHDDPENPPGEDFNFFKDTDIVPRVAPLHVKHIKTLPI